MFKRLFTKHKKNNDFSVLTNSEPYSKDRAECLIEKYGFDFDRISKTEIRDLIEKEISDLQQSSSDYIRLLCGYLYCIGDESDIDLIKKVKYDISFDMGVMIDSEWIENLENKNMDKRIYLINEFISYCKNYYKINPTP